MACGCGSGSRAKTTSSAATTTANSGQVMTFEVKDNAGNVEQFPNRSAAQVFLARHGGVMRPI